ncbi:ATP-binding cassette sub-family C member 8 [Strongyloides ratti]|uniref:ABC-type glutathione-S-conjugate transporter n=1 Tax=Strongyloides ratti TaxID=34506 RepID=A0A090LUP1_STRRB|nr:ATP-binding cassette sub-family C member 8 [Strongyloides ratti]CEF71344.1 ATP-binding cassette sub-family C member 8 [Strongyloides ratti]
MFLEIIKSVCENNQTELINVFSKNVTFSQTLENVASCYQNNILSIIPSLFLFIFFPILMFALYKSKNPKLEVCSPIGGRIIIGIILIFLTAIQFFHNIYRKWYLDENIPLSWIYSTCIRYVSLCFALLLTLACRNRGVVTSGVLFNFWLLLLICSIPEFVTRYKYYFEKQNIFIKLFDEKFELPGYDDDNKISNDTIQNLSFILFFPLLILQVIFSCFVDTPKYHITNEKECPENYTSFLNQITFNWFTPMAYTGFKRALTMDDLWNLNSTDESKNIVNQFNKNFNNEMKKFAMKKLRKQKKEKRQGKVIKLEEQKLTNENQISSKTKKDSEDDGDAPSILWPLFLTFKMTFIGSGFYKLIFDLLQFISPKLLSLLINFVEDKKQPLWIGLTISITMFLVALFQSMILHQYFHNMFRLGMNIRSALISTVYRKALFLSNTSRRQMTVGEIVNIMSVDIQRFQDMTTFVMLFWSAPLQVLLAIYFLWDLLGVSVFAGLIILLLMVPLNSFISIKMRNCQVTHMKLKDERMKMVNEVIGGIKVLKLYNWENSLENIITGIRKKELLNLKKLAYLNAATSLSWSSAPFLVAVVTFGVYVTIDPQNNILTPQITFVALALFNILRFPLAIFAMIFSQAVQCYVSNKRLKNFLAADEIDPNDIETRINSSGKALTIKDASFTWIKETDSFLKNINMSIEKGSLVAIVGRTGSGKSSLLSSLLGEMTKEKGTIHINGSIAYVPQQAWIQNLSLKDNILFNKQYDEIMYKKVIESCSLKQDFEALPNGDLTEIGEKGINLSGGQKQRVNLARAVYANQDIYIIDDALSAVDAHVGKHIFDNVLSTNSGLLKEKTRLLVTHSLHLLKYCDYIYVMKDGKISEEGNYSQLIKNNGELAELLEEFLIEEAKTRGRSVSFGEDAEEVKEVLDHLEGIDPLKKKRIENEIFKTVEEINASNENIINKHDILSQKNSIENETTKLIDNVNDNKENNIMNINKGQIIQKEGVETGKVKLSVYISYFKAIGLFNIFKFIIIYVLSSALGVLSNLSLADWSDNAKKIQSSNNTEETNQRLGVYTILGLSQAAFVCFASIIMALGMVSASSILHQSMLSRILRSPMSFFDITPIGRILNRFGKDIEVLDSRLPGSILNFISNVIGGATIIIVPIIVTPKIIIPLIPMILGYIFLLDVEGLDAAIPRSFLSFIRTFVASLEILLVIVLVTPWFGVILIPLVIIYFLILRFYVNTSRQLKRLESTTRSPIYSHFQESVQGAASIRAYGVVENFVYESNKRVDHNLITYYPSIVANRWLAVRLELVGNLIVLFAALFSVFGREGSGLTAGLVGLSVAYALNVTQTLNWAVRMTSELETNIVAVERIKEYAELDTEADTKTDPRIIQLPTSWPNEGHIVFKNISLRYRKDLDPVLKDISVEIEPKEKVGIVGRTGAGKSSLTLALFRIVEIDSGSIIIDGIDISKIGLNDLRSRITIVPQDPMLFSGKLRDNLDPFYNYDDDCIWRALQLTHLDAFVTALPNQLDHQIAESGNNLSVGQRQLLCLARALLRKSTILLLDEASASVDVETDQLIQKTIQEQFNSCTVLTIAHRLNTIKNSDKILVLDKGCVAEFDTPEKLLANPNGIFRSLMKEANLLPENY